MVHYLCFTFVSLFQTQIILYPVLTGDIFQELISATFMNNLLQLSGGSVDEQFSLGHSEHQQVYQADVFYCLWNMLAHTDYKSRSPKITYHEVKTNTFSIKTSFIHKAHFKTSFPKCEQQNTIYTLKYNKGKKENQYLIKQSGFIAFLQLLEQPVLKKVSCFPAISRGRENTHPDRNSR